MYPQLKCGGRVMRDVAGPRHKGWNGGLTRMDAVSSSVWRMESPLPKKFYVVMRCCHKDCNDAQVGGNGLFMSATAAGIAFKTKA